MLLLSGLTPAVSCESWALRKHCSSASDVFFLPLAVILSAVRLLFPVPSLKPVLVSLVHLFFPFSHILSLKSENCTQFCPLSVGIS